MAALLDEKTLAAFARRVEAVQPEAPRRWGKLTAHGMISHLYRSMEISLGEVEGIKDQSIPGLRGVLAFLIFRVLPFPRGLVKAPDIFTPPPREEFESERKDLLAIMKRFVETSAQEPERKTVNPMLGPTTLNYWRRIHGKHFEHHLKQFGA
ncbi:MAG: hypothetical protein KIS92_20265 [Planctomycetota bacterium]|nr:hypothetical protein [Planctomycetota bacterium]